MSYTVMGDGVNIAARLEGINKEFRTRICISHGVFKEAGERLCVRPIDDVTVKGRRVQDADLRADGRLRRRRSGPGARCPQTLRLSQADAPRLRGPGQGRPRAGDRGATARSLSSFRTIRLRRRWSKRPGREERCQWKADCAEAAELTCRRLVGLALALAALRPSEYTAALIQVLQAQAGRGARRHGARDRLGQRRRAGGAGRAGRGLALRHRYRGGRRHLGHAAAGRARPRRDGRVLPAATCGCRSPAAAST